MIKKFLLLSCLLFPLAVLADVGDIDSSFAPSVDDELLAVAIQSDGKILIGGYFGAVGVNSQYYIARLDIDGTFDGTFTPNVAGGSANVNAIAVQEDGKILIGGDFDTVNGQPRSNLARLNADGTLDSTFTADADGEVHAIAIQTDGKILVAGAFFTINSTSKERVARLSAADGSADTSFTADAAGGIVYSLAIEADGDVLIGGGFSTINSTARNRIARVDSSGNLDTSFNPNSNGLVRAIAVQDNGQIVLAGSFSTIASAFRDAIARLNADGTLDTAFDLSAFNGGGSADIYSLCVQADGKLLVGGDFTSLVGESRSSIARINTDNSADLEFNPGANSSVRAIQVQDDGRVVFAGYFTQVLNPVTSRSKIARFEGGAPNAAPTDVSATAGDASATVSWSAVVGEISSYTATSSPGGAVCSATAPTLTCNVSGLTNNTSYAFSVTADNMLGSGPNSEASNLVMPLAPTPTPTPVPTATPTPSVCFGGVLDAPSVQKKGPERATVRLAEDKAASVACVVTLRGQLTKSKKKVSKLLALGKRSTTFKKLSKGKWRFFYTVRSTELDTTQTSPKKTVTIE